MDYSGFRNYMHQKRYFYPSRSRDFYRKRHNKGFIICQGDTLDFYTGYIVPLTRVFTNVSSRIFYISRYLRRVLKRHPCV